jgi:hypothetical protein
MKRNKILNLISTLILLLSTIFALPQWKAFVAQFAPANLYEAIYHSELPQPIVKPAPNITAIPDSLKEYPACLLPGENLSLAPTLGTVELAGSQNGLLDTYEDRRRFLDFTSKNTSFCLVKVAGVSGKDTDLRSFIDDICRVEGRDIESLCMTQGQVAYFLSRYQDSRLHSNNLGSLYFLIKSETRQSQGEEGIVYLKYRYINSESIGSVHDLCDDGGGQKVYSQTFMTPDKKKIFYPSKLVFPKETP